MPQARTDCIHYTTTQTYLYEDFVGVGWGKKRPHEVCVVI